MQISGSGSWREAYWGKENTLVRKLFRWKIPNELCDFASFEENDLQFEPLLQVFDGKTEILDWGLIEALKVLQNKWPTVVSIWLFKNLGTASNHCQLAEDSVLLNLLSIFAFKVAAKSGKNLTVSIIWPIWIKDEDTRLFDSDRFFFPNLLLKFRQIDVLLIDLVIPIGLVEQLISHVGINPNNCCWNALICSHFDCFLLPDWNSAWLVCLYFSAAIETREADDCQNPMFFVFVDGHDDEILFEDIDIICPPFDTLMTLLCRRQIDIFLNWTIWRVCCQGFIEESWEDVRFRSLSDIWTKWNH